MLHLLMLACTAATASSPEADRVVRCDAADGAGEGRVSRQDRGELRPGERTAEGFLLCEGVAAIAGVYPYHRADGTVVRELISGEELKKADSLATLARKPVTLEHPKQGMVTPKNAKELVVGDNDGEVVYDSGFVKVKMAIRRDDALAAIDNRDVTELSLGYTCRIDATPGTHPEFGAYDAIQVDRRYNHTALVSAARHGHAARFRADAAVQLRKGESMPVPTPPAPAPEVPVKLAWLALLALPTRTDAQTTEVRKGLEDGGMARTDADALLTAIDSGRAAIVEVGRRDAAAAQACADAEKPEAVAAAAQKDLDAKLAFVAERAPLLALAESFKVDSTEAPIAKMDNDALRKAIAVKADPEIRKDAAPNYYAAYVDLIAKRADSSAPYAGLRGLAKPPAAAPGRTDAAKDAPEVRKDRFATAFEQSDPHRRA